MKKILLTCSAGGHLAEMRQLAPMYKGLDHFFVTFERPDSQSLAEKEKVYFIPRPARNPMNTLRAFRHASKIIEREKPSLVISTGADVTVPVCIAAWLNGIPIVFIESFCRTEKASLTGKILQRISRYTLYQWPELKKNYPNGVYTGSIFSMRGERA